MEMNIIQPEPNSNIQADLPKAVKTETTWRRVWFLFIPIFGLLAFYGLGILTTTILLEGLKDASGMAGLSFAIALHYLVVAVQFVGAVITLLVVHRISKFKFDSLTLSFIALPIAGTLFQAHKAFLLVLEESMSSLAQWFIDAIIIVVVFFLINKLLGLSKNYKLGLPITFGWKPVRYLVLATLFIGYVCGAPYVQMLMENVKYASQVRGDIPGVLFTPYVPTWLPDRTSYNGEFWWDWYVRPSEIDINTEITVKEPTPTTPKASIRICESPARSIYPNRCPETCYSWSDRKCDDNGKCTWSNDEDYILFQDCILVGKTSKGIPVYRADMSKNKPSHKTVVPWKEPMLYSTQVGDTSVVFELVNLYVADIEITQADIIKIVDSLEEISLEELTRRTGL